MRVKDLHPLIASSSKAERIRTLVAALTLMLDILTTFGGAGMTHAAVISACLEDVSSQRVRRFADGREFGFERGDLLLGGSELRLRIREEF